LLDIIIIIMDSPTHKYGGDFPANAAKEHMDREGKGKKFDSADWALQQQTKGGETGDKVEGGNADKKQE